MKHKCIGCGKMFEEKNIIFDVDPYDEEINGSIEKVWECSNCREQSCADI